MSRSYRKTPGRALPNKKDLRKRTNKTVRHTKDIPNGSHYKKIADDDWWREGDNLWRDLRDFYYWIEMRASYNEHWLYSEPEEFRKIREWIYRAFMK